ncbi:MAG: hypothetical protein ACI841_001329 [Planctomycetota bacterium]|jgi:hypothetical protein
MLGFEQTLVGGKWSVVTSTESSAGSAQGLEKLLEELMGGTPARFLRRVPGRETFASSELPGVPGGWIVKRFGRGPRADDWFERVRGAGVRPPARREFENLMALEQLGLPVPQAVLWGAQVSGDRSLVVMREIEHKSTLRDALAGNYPPAGMESLLALVLGLHKSGWYHRDLYLQHFVIPHRQDGGELERGGIMPRPRELMLLDLGRCRKDAGARRRWFEKDIAALFHSCPQAVSRQTQLRFLSRYLDGRGLALGPAGRPERREWARAIEKRRARMASHTPRFGEEPEK